MMRGPSHGKGRGESAGQVEARGMSGELEEQEKATKATKEMSNGIEYHVIVRDPTLSILSHTSYTASHSTVVEAIIPPRKYTIDIMQLRKPYSLTVTQSPYWLAGPVLASTIYSLESHGLMQVYIAHQYVQCPAPRAKTVRSLLIVSVQRSHRFTYRPSQKTYPCPFCP